MPFETRSPFQASGIRLGTPAVTSRGFVEADMDEVASCIDAVLKAIDTPSLEGVLESVRSRVAILSAKYPLPY